mgnify:CR=1 FL=1
MQCIDLRKKEDTFKIIGCLCEVGRQSHSVHLDEGTNSQAHVKGRPGKVITDTDIFVASKLSKWSLIWCWMLTKLNGGR